MVNYQEAIDFIPRSMHAHRLVPGPKLLQDGVDKSTVAERVAAVEHAVKSIPVIFKGA